MCTVALVQQQRVVWHFEKQKSIKNANVHGILIRVEISNDDKWDQKGGKYTKEIATRFDIFSLCRFKIEFSVAFKKLNVKKNSKTAKSSSFCELVSQLTFLIVVWSEKESRRHFFIFSMFATHKRAIAERHVYLHLIFHHSLLNPRVKNQQSTL